jgi:hypothetical protein
MGVEVKQNIEEGVLKKFARQRISTAFEKENP